MRTLQETHARARAHERRKGWGRSYPDHPMIDPQFKLKRKVRRALVKFRRAKPFRMDRIEFVRAVGELYADLSAAYQMPAPMCSAQGPAEGDSGESSYSPHEVTLRGRPSVLTALHEFAHARGYGEQGAVWWSVNAFRLIFPRSFARLVPEGTGTHFLVRGGEEVADRTPEQAAAFWEDYYASRAAAGPPPCAVCQSEPGTEQTHTGDRWCRRCLRQGERENAAMARAEGGRRRRRPGAVYASHPLNLLFRPDADEDGTVELRGPR